MADKRVAAEHGIVCYMPHERYGYFAWPSITRMPDGTLVVGASGLRYDHVCPWGKAVLFRSNDEGRTWSPPWILSNTPLSDYCPGVVPLGGKKLLVTWYSLDIRPMYEWAKKSYGLSEEEQSRWQTVFDTLTDDVVAKWQHSWIRTSIDGEAWGDFIEAPVNTPCGPIVCRDGSLLYFGKAWVARTDATHGRIMAARSTDEGKTWTKLGMVPVPNDTYVRNFHEPYVVELPSGKLIGLMRHDNDQPTDYQAFSLFQTESEDGGRTWSQAKYLNIYGAPPHLIRHSSGALVCVYSYRRPPLGQRAMISWDDGRTWDHDWILRDDAPPRDHGYPCSVEMPDATIFTVYYQRVSDEYKNCGILWSRWTLPDRP